VFLSPTSVFDQDSYAKYKTPLSAEKFPENTENPGKL
jgi:hypothetical protein